MNNQVHSTAYRVVATNSSAASENRIHSDADAARWGFRGGLVPGVTLYGYACHVLLETLVGRVRQHPGSLCSSVLPR
jgi:hypothetical protein